MSGIATSTLSAAAIGDEIETFIRGHFQIPASDSRFSRQLNLWEEGYVDSVGVVETIEFLESHFGITIPEEVLFSPDFTCIDGIARFVVTLRASGSHAPPV